MRIAALLFVGLVAFATSSVAQVDMDSGNFHVDGCRLLASTPETANNASDMFKMGLCAGTIDTLVELAALMPEEVRFCLPGQVTRKQVAQVIVRYLEQHPESLHRKFVVLASAALLDAFPCR
jgi:hypothetical protein